MARRPFVRSGGRGARRKTQWIRTDAASGGTDFKALAAATAVIDQNVPGVAPDTIIRLRGMLQVASDQSGANEEPFGAFGIAVVSEQAFAIGVTAVPTPYTDADSDLWMMHGYFAAPIRFNDATGFGNISQRVDFDSKAMRKLNEDETLIIVLENASATDGIRYTFNVAILVKVP